MVESVLRVRELLVTETLRFCDRSGLEPVATALSAGMTASHVTLMRALLPGGGEPALFAAIALATAGDSAGLDVLRRPQAYFVTNSCFEVGLALCARLVLSDATAPLSFINASMLGELAVAVGAFGGRR